MAPYGNNVTSDEVYNMFRWQNDLTEEDHKNSRKKFTTQDKNKYLLKNAPSQLWMRNDVNCRQPVKTENNGLNENVPAELYHYRDGDPTPFARVDRTMPH